MLSFEPVRENSYTYSSRVNGNAVILVVDLGISDGDTNTITDVESISVVAKLITSTVVDSHRVNFEVIRVNNANGHKGCVLNVQVVDVGRDQIMGIEELGLLLSLGIGTQTIPPSFSMSIESSTSSVDCNALPTDLEKRAGPLGVAPGGSTLEDDLEVLLVMVYNVKLCRIIRGCCRSNQKGQEGC